MRFLSAETVDRTQVQLVGVAALWIASKLNEVSVPLVSDFAWITYDTYASDEVVPHPFFRNSSALTD